MAAPTLIILPGLEGGEAIVATASGQGHATSRVAVADVPSLGLSEPVIILPGQWVRIFETELPKAGRAQQLKMSRFAREDDIANGADELHFALSDAQPPALAVVDKRIMNQLFEALGASRPKAIFADYDLLMGEEAVLVIDRAVEPQRAAVDLDWTDENLVQLPDSQLASTFAEAVYAGHGLNLMQGDYRPRSNLNLPRVPLIRFAALAASAALALFIWSGVQDRSAATQAKDLRAQTAADYLALTGERAPNNPGRVAAQSVKSGSVTRTGFLDLSSILFTGLSEFDDLRVDQLRYNAEDGVLRLRLIYPSFDAASRAESAVAKAGGILTTGGVREQNGAFVGDATLSVGGAS
ncbi:hypothetical protein GCM10011309_19090 [Litorimonas cladophorae]|uniref:GspL periplasmic domain-containing protein n=1 Tax=Litorimonas cladophorae TaxID=1220491 RepID=A0A918KMC3_9PROT|nr:type II secretion system protein GspL [Litorimonas cladophorae]GGX69300.1 hypothetical protein GCM10011309_19090 [Litorimonas cladophorae]